MGTHGDRQWAKGLEECKNPDHQHLKQPGTDVELIHWKLHNRAISDVEYARLEGYQEGYDKGREDGIALMKKLDPWVEKANTFGTWLDKMLFYAVGIYIGGVMASGKWIWW